MILESIQPRLPTPDEASARQRCLHERGEEQAVVFIFLSMGEEAPTLFKYPVCRIYKTGTKVVVHEMI